MRPTQIIYTEGTMAQVARSPEMFAMPQAMKRPTSIRGKRPIPHRGH